MDWVRVWIFWYFINRNVQFSIMIKNIKCDALTFHLQYSIYATSLFTNANTKLYRRMPISYIVYTHWELSLFLKMYIWFLLTLDILHIFLLKTNQIVPENLKVCRSWGIGLIINMPLLWNIVTKSTLKESKGCYLMLRMHHRIIETVAIILINF